jgi:hypothetical protein
MEPDAPSEPPVETDERFPSGPWTGFFLQKIGRGKHWMELHLTFRDGRMSGMGRDWVGEFVIAGRYEVESGRCRWTKSYIAKHDVRYDGYNEGRGIWGTWTLLSMTGTGGFHIWPEGMSDPTQPAMSAEAEVPVEPEAVEAEGVLADPVAAAG